ncbi:unnamed protein product [Haemonchus placei]|uniref:Remorin_C domain-containing protein n=1 Tax=Haemonchus placei TaxID=6290 RepID=A0A0N4W813_HAEPC|nr:unnamed protein product [Haemonchus placei]
MEAVEFEAQSKLPRGDSEKRWRDVIKKDLAEAKVTAEDAVDRMKRRRLTRTTDSATGINAREKKKKKCACVCRSSQFWSPSYALAEWFFGTPKCLICYTWSRRS